jgi:hypothetical protein
VVWLTGGRGRIALRVFHSWRGAGGVFRRGLAHVRQRDKGSRTRDGVLDRVANEGITRPENERQHHGAKPAALAAFPEQQHSGDGQGGEEKGIAAGERHDHVEDGIAQGPVDKTEHANIQIEEPMHARSLMKNAGMKTELRK